VTSQPTIDYAIVTVKLDNPSVERAAAFEEIKHVLKLSHPVIDEEYGAIPLQGGYVVLIDHAVAQKMKDENHPNILGVFSNPRLGPNHQPAAPGKTGPAEDFPVLHSHRRKRGPQP
jgi:hypothetical protein